MQVRGAAAVGTAVALCLATAPAFANEALQKLVPLMEVYRADGKSPEFDVAGIRCAGLFLAQSEWARQNGGAGQPSKARIRDIETNLARAEQHRLNRGQGLVAAQENTRSDVLRVHRLYTARFTKNAAGGADPWGGDRLIRDDTRYCDLLAGRR